ncbi:CAF17-like 4Fe-4S cluster assembly/insertion protein YgfZ [Anaeromyxobacter diazotrophicus]|uniref:Glycine cleavage system protein T n=1 Tax=Anaeromyxobacter diazotrophicus TaxID=2590199 RepID=A0A7I9VRY0_9BACT|nr:folate-binding protein YgfZ [Anaeromyxobacter diazotrophicus]GEJ58819.1 glycine cleavage system protein T [Anaeromyxobacter diazotrophicus]
MSSLADRLAAARSGAAVGPALARGLLRLTGRQRLEFVHRLSTQSVKALQPGAVAHLAFLDGKAHVIGDALLAVRPGDLLLEVEPEVAEPLRAHLARYVLRDDVKLEDLSAALRVVPALGPEGVALARARAPQVAAFEHPRRGAPALDVALPAAEAEGLREALVAAGATPLGAEDLEVLRVLGGVPRQGADIDPARLVMEAALTASAVAFDKGCYLGQEIVLRGTFRGQIQRGLVQLALPAGAGPGAALRAGGQEVGAVTSAVETPEGRVGLGYLRRAHWNEGERLETEGGEAVVRRVLVAEREPAGGRAPGLRMAGR